MEILIFPEFYSLKVFDCDSLKWNFESLLHFSQVEVELGIYYVVLKSQVQDNINIPRTLQTHSCQNFKTNK